MMRSSDMSEPTSPVMGTTNLTPDEFRRRALQIEAEVGNIIVGQRDLIRQVVVTL